MNRTVIPLLNNEVLAGKIADKINAKLGQATFRRYPDCESYVRVDTPVSGHEVILVCTLDRPDDKMLPLLFTARTARDLGATRVGLVAPYLAYMRQDKRFQPGEGITSTYFANFVSSHVDWLVTVDPHLHRRGSLAEIYSIPTFVVHAAPVISEWIRAYVKQPVLIGPDIESTQWVASVAQGAEAPYVILEKARHGDRDVEVAVPNIERWRNHTPVLVDDIISTARTMIETIGHLKQAGLISPVCIGVHGVFADQAYTDLLAAGASRIVTCNTIPHVSNGIDTVGLLSRSVQEI